MIILPIYEHQKEKKGVQTDKFEVILSIWLYLIYSSVDVHMIMFGIQQKQIKVTIDKQFM